VKGLLVAANKAQVNFEKTGKLTTVVAASSTDKNSIMYKAPYSTEENRGLIAEYDNKFNVASWRGWLTYNALNSAKSCLARSCLSDQKRWPFPKAQRPMPILRETKSRRFGLIMSLNLISMIKRMLSPKLPTVLLSTSQASRTKRRAT
jgi:hypothetical protein